MGHYAQLTGNIPINLIVIVFDSEKNEMYFGRMREI